ncbi:MAG: thiol:disulfide interchange protein DsbA [Candidatus Malihini olakiniferum]
MKSVFAALLGIMLAFGSSATYFYYGKQYIEVNKPVSQLPQVLEFFSFYCQYCYQFTEVYHIPEMISKVLPTDTKITRYHVDFLGPLGKSLTKAWAIAIILGVEDKVAPLMFHAVQKSQTLKTTDDICKVFVAAGVKAEDYDSALNSFAVKALVSQQEKAAADLQLCGVPAMFINGKYMVKSDGLDTNSIDTYVKKYTDVVKFLIEKK